MSSAVLSEIEKTVSHLTHNEELRLIEQLVHHSRQPVLARDLHQQATFESQIAAMSTDPGIQNVLQKIDQEFVATEVYGLEN